MKFLQGVLIGLAILALAAVISNQIQKAILIHDKHILQFNGVCK